MLTVGEKFPEFSLPACVGLEPGSEFKTITNSTFKDLWQVVFFWPLDFTFVCPTEIAEFGSKTSEFSERKAVVLGASCDSQYVHLAWRNSHPDLKDLPFPMLADIKRELSTNLGILHKTEGIPLRATFIVDPTGTIRFASTHDLSTGRNVDEVLRTLDALQTGSLCPVNWKKGQKTL